MEDIAEKSISPKHESFYHKARLSFENKQYKESLPNLDSLLKYYSENTTVKYMTGVSELFDLSRRKASLNRLKSLNTEAQFLPDYFYWLGYAYELNDSTNRAMECYQTYKNICEKPNQKAICSYLEDAKRQEDNLHAAQKMRDYLNIVNIKNIGPPINTEDEEYVPLVPSDESFMIYTYRGKYSKGGKQSPIKGKRGPTKKEEKIYFEDVFVSYRVNDTTWGEPSSIKSINTNLHDAAVTLSSDGTLLFIYKNLGAGNGDLYMSKLEGSSWSQPKYQRGLNSDRWDGSAAFFPDNKRIIFSSERKGGLGGKDLYTAELIGEDTWGNITNLGPTINTPYDEDAPFITADGSILFFASNGKLSTGGYDILRSDFVDGNWQKPYNIGKPINTPQDDKFYTVTADGKKGYYSTEKENGYGRQDIYCIEPGIAGKPLKLVQISGIVTLDEKPAKAFIQVNNPGNKLFKPVSFESNSSSGKFLMNLPEGQKFELVFTCNNLPEQRKYINTMNIDSFIPVTVIADFYTDDYRKKIEQKMDSLNMAMEKMDKNSNYADFSSKYGDVVIDSLYYKVQIGAYKFIENFDYTKTMQLGKIIRKVYDDGITRFTVGNYKTFNQALMAAQKIRESAVKDAFIIGVYKGKYMYLQDIQKLPALINKK